MTIDCAEVGVNIRELCIRFPGGANLCASPPDLIAPPLDELVLTFLGQANAALAPLNIIFDIINALSSVVDVFKAVATLNPAEILEALDTLIDAISGLLNILPPLSVPALIKDLIEALILYLQGFVDRLEALQIQQVKIDTARTLAIDLNLTDLLSGVICAENQFSDITLNLQSSVGPVNSIIQLINFLGSLIGLPPLEIGDITGSLDEMIDAINVLISILRSIADAIPL